MPIGAEGPVLHRLESPLRLHHQRTGTLSTVPEHARFVGLRCEIQLKTILNHAWAELENDLYKAPALSPDFGDAALDTIKQRFQHIASSICCRP